MEQYNETGMVICQECGKAFQLLIKQHLQFHNLTFQEYKNKYPDFPTCGKAYSAKQKLKNVKLFDNSETIIKIKESPVLIEDILREDNFEYTKTSPEIEKDLVYKKPEEIKIEDLGDIDIDKIPVVSKEYINEISNFIEEVKTFSNEQTYPEFPNPGNSIHKDKIKFLNVLLMYFGNNVKNSYFINKMNMQGGIEERIVTDISILNKKINIEFPNTFWHNFDISKSIRDSKLKLMGWKVIDISGPKPSIQDLKKALQKFNLI